MLREAFFIFKHSTDRGLPVAKVSVKIRLLGLSGGSQNGMRTSSDNGVLSKAAANFLLLSSNG